MLRPTAPRLMTAKALEHHGERIFLYKNLLTNQDTHARNQMPYWGKKSVPRKIRKDLWTPFLTVSFPSTNQGLQAYHKLQEFRKVRDYMWDNYDPRMVDDGTDWKAMRKERDDTNKYDDGEWKGKSLFRRKSRKKRAGKMMDQTANSVADVASILHNQERLANERREGRERELQEKEQMRQRLDNRLREERSKRVEEWNQMAEKFKDGTIESLQAKIESLTNRLAAEKESLSELQKGSLSGQLLKFRQRKNRIIRAHQAKSDGKIEELVDLEVKADEAKIAAQEQIPGKVVEQLKSTAVALSTEAGTEQNPTGEASADKIIYSMDGVTIDWANRLDSEFAESWPDEVRHRDMGHARHTAPSTAREPNLLIPDKYKCADWVDDDPEVPEDATGSRRRRLKGMLRRRRTLQTQVERRKRYKARRAERFGARPDTRALKGKQADSNPSYPGDSQGVEHAQPADVQASRPSLLTRGLDRIRNFGRA